MKSNLLELINSDQIKLIGTSLIDSDGIYEIKVTKDIDIKIKSGINAILKIDNKIDKVNIDIKVDENSNIGYYVVNDNTKVNTVIDIDENSFLEVYNFYMGSCDTNTVINLNKYNARVSYNTGLSIDKKSESNHRVRINHLAKYTSSEVFKKGVTGDESKCSFDVASYIEKGNHNCNAYQKSSVITLSDKATSNINPVLLIDDYDVTGGHGATISKVSDDDLYYMETRGIPKKEATKLLTLGFLLENVPKFMVSEIEVLLKGDDINE